MKALPLFIIALVLAFAVAPVYAPPPPIIFSDPVKVADLIADGGPNGSHLDVGDVYVKTAYQFAYQTVPENRRLQIVVTTAAGWTMTAVYIDVEDSSSEFPTNGVGNPKPGQFWLNRVGINTVSLGATSIAFIGGRYTTMTLYIAIHARVYNAATTTSEGAWAKGLSGEMTANGQFSGPSWATYIIFDSLPIYWWESD